MGRRLLALVAATCLLSGCSGDGDPDPGASPEPSLTPSTASPSAAPPELPVTHKTKWLCHPSKDGDPCDVPLTTTAVRADGSTSRQTLTAEADPSVDCFYVYPTVSEAQSAFAPLKVTPALVEVAVAQAAAFSSVCDVFAPVYRQRTLAGLLNGTPNVGDKGQRAYDDVRSAFHDYLNTHPGRPFVLIGHSQGSFVLTRLIQEMLDGDTPEATALRERLVSALVIGAAVKTRPGEALGGDFQRVPLCGQPGDTGCVVAYNTYASEPGPDAIFGRPDPNRGLDASCTSPAALLGEGRGLHPLFPASRAANFGDFGAPMPDTTFVSLPRYVTGRCESRDGFAWFQVAVRDDPSDVRGDALPQTLPLDWGLHRIDVSVALGDLVELVRRQSGQ